MYHVLSFIPEAIIIYHDIKTKFNLYFLYEVFNIKIEESYFSCLIILIMTPKAYIILDLQIILRI